ncbi:PKD domain-containing protein [Fulvivirga sp. M361]|uniref:T9SS type B sorting domain-containing protein n=1 Tax=Fulvivirga sp. M361 TaxID=2594266 RepID=UPI00117A8AAA|nr:gliding motility-associated C-terminal domain-containing protein [Fulvivirga sp. M361]TRX60187.1 PKD domain-containing protein [Fulvivirga sp. M361]
MNLNIKLFFLVLSITIINCPNNYGQVLEKDSLALVALYDSTGGESWVANTNWKQGPVNTWNGITTVNDRVTEISLPSNNLQGRIPSRLGELDSLKDLELNINALSGEIPIELADLSVLEVLNFFNNELQGEVPKALESLSKLTLLALGQNKLKGELPSNLLSEPPFIGGDRILSLSDNSLTSLPNLSMIESLNVFAENNFLTFEHIEPNLIIRDRGQVFTYTPQKPVHDSIDVSVGTNARLVLNALVGGSANRYQWYKDGEMILGATSSTLTLNNISSADAGRYTTVITSDIVTDLTLERYPIKVNVLDRPVTAFCERTTLDATVEDPNATYTWSTGATIPLIEITEPGTYSVTIETASSVVEEQYVAELALADIVPGVDVIFQVRVNEQDLAPEQALLVGGPVQFRNTSQAGNDFRWDFGDGGSSEQANPIHSFQLPGRYVVGLSAQDDKGCDVVYQQEVQIQELFVTNAITPNGDGDNDRLYVEPFLYPASLRVINRWGQEVYYAENYKDDFDGTSLQAGVYFYELVIEGTRQKLTGNVSIVK